MEKIKQIENLDNFINNILKELEKTKNEILNFSTSEEYKKFTKEPLRKIVLKAISNSNINEENAELRLSHELRIILYKYNFYNFPGIPHHMQSFRKFYYYLVDKSSILTNYSCLNPNNFNNKQIDNLYEMLDYFLFSSDNHSLNTNRSIKSVLKSLNELEINLINRKDKK